MRHRITRISKLELVFAVFQRSREPTSRKFSGKVIPRAKLALYLSETGGLPTDPRMRKQNANVIRYTLQRGQED